METLWGYSNLNFKPAVVTLRWEDRMFNKFYNGAPDKDRCKYGVLVACLFVNNVTTKPL